MLSARISLLSAVLISSVVAAPEFRSVPIFISGTEGYHTYRIPAIVRANDGTLLAFAEGRVNSSSDAGNIDIVLKRSSDNGLTWSALSLVEDEGGDALTTVGNPAPVVDRTTGHIHLLFCIENDTVFHIKSTDNGLTWSERTEITNDVKLPEWGWYATGPCHGVQLTRGNQAGRLVIPANHRIGNDGSDSGSFGAQVLYSDDQGATWQMTATSGEINGTGPNETTLVELNSQGSPASSTSSHASADIPKTISATGTPTITSTLDVAGISGNLTDVNVTLDITHTYTSDLVITLIHPDGTRIELSSGNGTNGDNYTGTTFDQQAATTITAGTAPFTGTFSPEGDLSTLNTKSPNGQWSLEIQDTFAQDGGSLNAWSISLTTDAPVAGFGSHIYINSRDYGSDAGNRSEAFSGDGGTSYTTPYDGNAHFVTPVCQGSLVRFSATDDGDATNRILFCSPNGSSRSTGSLWTSTDEAQSWSEPKVLHDGAFAYSDMTKTADGGLGILGETDSYGAITFFYVNEEWLGVPPPPSSDPQQGFWSFEEKSAGVTADTTQASVLDISPTGNQHNLTPSAAFSYTAGSTDFYQSTALSFAANGKASISDSDTLNHFDFAADSSFTLEAVFRIPNGHSSTGCLVAKDFAPNSPSWWMRVESGGNLRFLVADSTSEAIANTDTKLVNDGEWHHVAAIKNATTDRLIIYLDGSLVADVEDTTTGDHSNSQALSIGQFNSGSHSFTGDIDFIRISPSALAPADFVQRYTQNDADNDHIADSYELDTSGGTQTLGAGDTDGDRLSDFAEFATGSSPIEAGSVPITTLIQTSPTSYTFSYIQRHDTPWLDITPEYSTDLINWSSSIAGATATESTQPFGTNLTQHTWSISSTSPLPTIFSRITVQSSK